MASHSCDPDQRPQAPAPSACALPRSACRPALPATPQTLTFMVEIENCAGHTLQGLFEGPSNPRMHRRTPPGALCAMRGHGKCRLKAAASAQLSHSALCSALFRRCPAAVRLPQAPTHVSPRRSSEHRPPRPLFAPQASLVCAAGLFSAQMLGVGGGHARAAGAAPLQPLPS